jgi:hypothetical protein
MIIKGDYGTLMSYASQAKMRISIIKFPVGSAAIHRKTLEVDCNKLISKESLDVF